MDLKQEISARPAEKMASMAVMMRMFNMVKI